MYPPFTQDEIKTYEEFGFSTQPNPFFPEANALLLETDQNTFFLFKKEARGKKYFRLEVYDELLRNDSYYYEESELGEVLSSFLNREIGK